MAARTCELEATLARDGRPCIVVSVGSNGQAEFEQAVHGVAPHCVIDTWDGTLVGPRASKRKSLPEFVHFVPRNFNERSWQVRNYTSGVRILKMDCEGCESYALLPWLEHVCTEQLAIEFHFVEVQHVGRLSWIPRLLRGLSREYQFFSGVPNLACGAGISSRVCMELSFQRRSPCPANR
eukprot:717714-Prymnesium_polylepis.2